MSSATGSLVLKVALGDDLRRISTPSGECTYADLCRTLRTLWPTQLPAEPARLAISSIDDEGDTILARSDAELAEAFRVERMRTSADPFAWILW